MSKHLEHLNELQNNGASYTDLVLEAARLAEQLVLIDSYMTVETGIVYSANRRDVCELLEYINNLTETQCLLMKVGSSGSHL